MFSENNTETIIEKRLFDNIPSDIDRSEGSFIYDAVIPTGKEIETAYKNMDKILDMTFAKAAAANGYVTQLELRCSESGIVRKAATLATGTITFAGAEGTNIPARTIIQSSSGLQFSTLAIATIESGTATVNIQATSEGTSYNLPSNSIIKAPISIYGVTSITNTVPTIGGTEKETDSALLERYLRHVQSPATSGNKNDYLNWALEVDGVGEAKVFPLWDGMQIVNGAVTVVIADVNKKAASLDLVKATYDHIEEFRPIGATVTVKTAVEKPLNINAKISIERGLSVEAVETEFTTLLTKYLESVAFDATYISIAKVGNILLNTTGVLDINIEDLKINDLTSNITLKNEEIAVVGTIDLGGI